MYVSMYVCKYASMQMFKCVQFKVYKCLSMQIYKYVTFYLDKSFSTWVCKYVSIQTQLWFDQKKNPKENSGVALLSPTCYLNNLQLHDVPQKVATKTKQRSVSVEQTVLVQQPGTSLLRQLSCRCPVCCDPGQQMVLFFLNQFQFSEHKLMTENSIIEYKVI